MGETHQLTPTPTLPKGGSRSPQPTNTRREPPSNSPEGERKNTQHSTLYALPSGRDGEGANHNTLLCDVVLCCLNRTANYAHYFRQRDKRT